MRLIFTLVLLALEATVISVPVLAMTTLNAPWPLIAGLVALGWQADSFALRSPQRRRAILGAGAGLAALLLPLTAHGGIAGLFAALVPGQFAFGSAYSLLLLGLFTFWRGTRLDSHDSAAIGNLFGRGTAVAVGALVLGGLLGTGTPASAPVVQIQVLALGMLGLTALALAHAQDAADGRLNDLSWRWVATLLAAVGLVLGLATGLAALLGGDDSLAAVQNLIALLIFPLALIGGIIAWFVITFLAEPIGAVIRAIIAALQRLQLPSEPEPAAESGPNILENLEVFETARSLAEGATLLMALIPVVLLVILILLLRPRQPKAQTSDEERSSLGALAGLGADLRDLLGRLRNPFARHPTGLQAALAALRGDDPTSRTRRAYVRLLLWLEARDQPRPPHQTPAEFAESMADMPAAASRAALTAAYERARYRPRGADPADALQAEAALQAMEQPPSG